MNWLHWIQANPWQVGIAVLALLILFTRILSARRATKHIEDRVRFPSKRFARGDDPDTGVPSLVTRKPVLVGGGAEAIPTWTPEEDGDSSTIPLHPRDRHAHRPPHRRASGE